MSSMGWTRLLSGKIQVDYMRQRLCSRMEVSWFPMLPMSMVFGSFFPWDGGKGPQIKSLKNLFGPFWKVVAMIQTIFAVKLMKCRKQIQGEVWIPFTYIALSVLSLIIFIIWFINATEWTFVLRCFSLARDTACSKAWFKALTKMSWQRPERGANAQRWKLMWNNSWEITMPML